MELQMRVFYFGCWNQPGHGLHRPGGASVGRDSHDLEFCGGVDGEGYRTHLDSALAPRKRTKGRGKIGALCWLAQGAIKDERLRIGYDSEEYPQGQFLRHFLTNGYTAIQWWDRCQGDTRGACNSTLLVEGERTCAEMLEALRTYFPHVVDNLTRAGVQLVEIDCTTGLIRI
jgi:hypothetical protein